MHTVARTCSPLRIPIQLNHTAAMPRLFTVPLMSRGLHLRTRVTRMVKPLLSVLSALAGLALSATVAVAQPPPEEVTVSGAVVAIDHFQRLLTVRGDQGNLVVVDVPVSLAGFETMRVGNVITLAYYDRVSIRPKPAGEPAVDRLLDAAATPPAQRVTTVTFSGWDPATRVVTFFGPKRAQYSRRLLDTDVSVVTGLRSGDRVDVVWSDALRLVGQPSAAPAAAEEFRHRFTISLLLGVDNQFSGNMIEEATGQTTTGAPIRLNETSYDDVYGRMELYKLGVGYRLSPRTEVAVNIVRSRSSSEIVDIGTVGTANVPLPVKFDDYGYWGIEGGQRFFFARVRFTPFVGYLAGINRHGDIRGAFINVPPSLTPGYVAQDGKFFEKSWAFSLGPTGGVLIGIGPFEVMAEAQLRFMGGLSDVDWLVEEGLRDINSESERWSLPLLVGARIRF